MIRGWFSIYSVYSNMNRRIIRNDWRSTQCNVYCNVYCPRLNICHGRKYLRWGTVWTAFIDFTGWNSKGIISRSRLKKKKKKKKILSTANSGNISFSFEEMGEKFSFFISSLRRDENVDKRCLETFKINLNLVSTQEN